MAENEPAGTNEARETAEQIDSPADEASVGSVEDALLGESVEDLKSLRNDLGEARERLLRAQAELDNYRKRAARQIEEERRYANLPLIRDLLHVWDNMNRAIQAAEQSGQSDSLLEGFKMVVGQMEEVLDRYHCKRIEAVGKPFDPHLHEAILQQPSEEHPHGTVTQETQTGFQLHDRVVRPSQVIVAAAPERSEENAE